jgi:hypothetical protein
VNEGLLVTAAEWDEMASVNWGSADDALAEVKRTVATLGPGDRFAVYDAGELQPSPTRPRQSRASDLDQDTVGGC